MPDHAPVAYPNGTGKRLKPLAAASSSLAGGTIFALVAYPNGTGKWLKPTAAGGSSPLDRTNRNSLRNLIRLCGFPHPARRRACSPLPMKWSPNGSKLSPRWILQVIEP